MFIQTQDCPNCGGIVYRGWLYCRNSINNLSNICGWKLGSTCIYGQTRRTAIRKLITSASEEITPDQLTWPEYEDSDRP